MDETFGSSLSHIPPLHRSVKELFEANQRLGQRRVSFSQESSALVPVKPVYELEKLERTYQPLENLRPFVATEPKPLPGHEYDFYEGIVADVISMSLDKLRDEGDWAFSKELERDWEATRSRILGELDHETKEQISGNVTTTTTSQQTGVKSLSTLDASVSRSFAPHMQHQTPAVEQTPKMLALYDAFQKGLELNFRSKIQLLKEASASVGSNMDTLELLRLAEFYIESVGNVGSFRTKRVRAARTFLEKQYREVLERKVGAKPGGDLRSAVQSVLKSYQGESLKFGIIFQLARAGEWEAAKEESVGVDKAIASLLDKIQKCQLTPLIKRQGSRDVFRNALETLNDFDAPIDPSILTSVEDFLWVRLCAVGSSGSDEEISKKARELGNMVVKNGPDYFGAGSNPFLYARVLATCGEVERAIDFLATFRNGASSSTTEPTPTSTLDPLPDAVHLALVLRAANVLQVTTSTLNSNPTTSSYYVEDSRCLQYGRLMEQYAKQCADATKALTYVSYYPVNRHADLIPAKKILARPAPSGGPLPLLKILKLNLGEKDASLVAYDAAQQAREIDAINIYFDAINADLEAGHLNASSISALEKAIQLVIRELSRLMMNGEMKTPEYKLWRREVVRMSQLESSVNSNVSSAASLSRIEACAVFFDECASGDEDAPLKLTKWLLPLTDRSDVNQKVQSFVGLDPHLIALFPQIVSMVIQCHIGASQKGKVVEAKERILTLVAFIAALREKADYRLRPDVERELAISESRYCI